MKRFRKFLINTLFFLIITLIVWIAGSICAWNWNPAHWWGLGRFVAILIEIGALVKAYD